MKPIHFIIITAMTFAMFCGCKQTESVPEPAKPAETQPESAAAKDDVKVDNAPGTEAAKPAGAQPTEDVKAPEQQADEAKVPEQQADDARAPEQQADDAKAPEQQADDAKAPGQTAVAGTPKPFEVTLGGQEYTVKTDNPQTAPDPDNPHEVYCPDDAKCAAAIKFGQIPPETTNPPKPTPIPPILIFNASFIEAESIGDIDGDGNDEISVLYTSTSPIEKWREYLIYGLKEDNGSKHWTEIAPSLPTNLTILWTTPYIPIEKSDKPGFAKVRHVDCTDPIDVETFKIIEKEVEISKLRDYIPQDSGKKE